MAKGKKTGGGSRLGSPNKSTQRVVELCARLNCDPFEVMALIASNRLECGVCRGTGKTKYQPGGDEKKPAQRVCQSCWGSKLERIDPKERGRNAAELAQYLAPKRKALEVQDEEGNKLEPMSYRMVIVDERKSGGSQSIPPQINSPHP